MKQKPVIEMQNIGKGFPGVVALNAVSIECYSGEIHALVGENGAGKSTLIKILSGVIQPDSGRITLDGEAVSFKHPLESLNAGISVIYQEFSLLPDRSVAQNIFLGRELTHRGILQNAQMNAQTRKILDMFVGGKKIDPETPLSSLDVASQQMVEIAKAISLNSKVLVMDEPTAALNEAECQELFESVEMLRDRGTAIIYITHRMREVTRLADKVTVLKDGEIAARFNSMPAPEDIVRAMVGRDITQFYAPFASPEEISQQVLCVKGGANASIHNINFSLHAGEILGIAGIQGAGRNALAMAIFGHIPFTQGEVTLLGNKVHLTNPRQAIAAGIGLLPGDRKSEGLTLKQSIRDNAMLSSRALAGIFSSHKANKYIDLAGIDLLLDKMEVKAPSYDYEIQNLSGGNQQKAIVARALSLNPKVLIFIEPTRGIDVNAKASIYQLMRDLARKGTGIIMISSDLPEVVGVSDRVLVMHEGTIAAEFPSGAQEADIMLAATGEMGAVA